MSELDPTRPIEEVPGGLRYHIYAQDGTLVPMTCADTPHNRRFIVWLRKFDRYSAPPTTQTENQGERE